MPTTRALAAAALAAGCLLLSSCMLLPGRFVSELTLRSDGTFAFSYTGDIHLVALSKLADEANKEGEAFTPSPCSAEDSGEERPCSADELSDQRSAWESAREAGKAKKKQDAEMMKTMLGGIDPGDPKAAEEFAARLRRQVGWRSVVDRGDGKFEVDFAIAGRLDHDFTFPTIERMPVISPFVTAIRRADGTVRVDAPAFEPNASALPMKGMMDAMAAKADGTPGGLPVLDGRFAVVTDGQVLANNTDEGPMPGPGGKRLDWKVNPQTSAAPTALIKLGR